MPRPLVIGISFHAIRTFGLAPFSSSFFTICIMAVITWPVGRGNGLGIVEASAAASHEVPGFVQPDHRVQRGAVRGSGALGSAL